MATDVTVILDDHPGELARLGECAGAAGVNIDGLAAFTGDGRGVVHVLVLGDEATGRFHDALRGEGMGIADEREVLVIDVDNLPGAMGELARRLARAGVNIDFAYTTFGEARIVIATDDMASARAAL